MYTLNTYQGHMEDKRGPRPENAKLDEPGFRVYSARVSGSQSRLGAQKLEIRVWGLRLKNNWV